MLKTHDESALKIENKKGETAIDLVKKNLDIIKRLRNKSSEVFEEEILEYLKNPLKVPFNLEQFIRKGTVQNTVKQTHVDNLRRANSASQSVSSKSSRYSKKDINPNENSDSEFNPSLRQPRRKSTLPKDNTPKSLPFKVESESD